MLPTVAWDQIRRTRLKGEKQPLLLYRRKPKDFIASLKQAQKRDQLLIRLHCCKKTGKKERLQEIYDENCRIFISLSKQKSQYTSLRKVNSPRSQNKSLRCSTESVQNVKQVGDIRHQPSQPIFVAVPKATKKNCLNVSESLPCLRKLYKLL